QPERDAVVREPDHGAGDGAQAAPAVEPAVALQREGPQPAFAPGLDELGLDPHGTAAVGQLEHAFGVPRPRVRQPAPADHELAAGAGHFETADPGQAADPAHAIARWRCWGARRLGRSRAGPAHGPRLKAGADLGGAAVGDTRLRPIIPLQEGFVNPGAALFVRPAVAPFVAVVQPGAARVGAAAPVA